MFFSVFVCVFSVAELVATDCLPLHSNVLSWPRASQKTQFCRLRAKRRAQRCASKCGTFTKKGRLTTIRPFTINGYVYTRRGITRRASKLIRQSVCVVLLSARPPTFICCCRRTPAVPPIVAVATTVPVCGYISEDTIF